MHRGQEGPRPIPPQVELRLGRCRGGLGTGSTSWAISVSGTFQQVTNLLNIMDSESAMADTAGTGPSLRKALASAIIAEKAASKPCVVLSSLIRCLPVPQVGPPPLGRCPEPRPAAACVHPPLSTGAPALEGAGLGATGGRIMGRTVRLSLLEDPVWPGL